MHALRRLMPEMNFVPTVLPYEKLAALQVREDDFLMALNEVEPSALREVFTEVGRSTGRLQSCGSNSRDRESRLNRHDLLSAAKLD